MDAQSEPSKYSLTLEEFLTLFNVKGSLSSLFKDKGKAALFIANYNTYAIHADFNFTFGSKLEDCLKLHPDLGQLYLESVDFEDDAQIKKALKQVVTVYAQYLPFVYTVLEKTRFNSKYFPYIIGASAIHPEGRAMFIQHLAQPILGNGWQCSSTNGRGLIRAAEQDPNFTFALLPLAMQYQQWELRKELMRCGIMHDEGFANHVLTGIEGAPELFPDYSKNTKATWLTYLYAFSSLKHEMQTHTDDAIKYHANIAKRFIRDDMETLLKIIHHEKLVTTIAYDKNIPHSTKIALLKTTKNKSLAKALRNSFDIHVLTQVLIFCPDEEAYIFEQRTNLSDKQKQYLKSEWNREKVKVARRKRADDQLQYSIDRYYAVCRENARKRGW